MAYLVGIVTKEEKAILEMRGWDCEPAERYGIVGDTNDHLITPRDNNNEEIIVIYVDLDLFEIMDGADWEK